MNQLHEVTLLLLLLLQREAVPLHNTAAFNYSKSHNFNHQHPRMASYQPDHSHSCNGDFSLLITESSVICYVGLLCQLRLPVDDELFMMLQIMLSYKLWPNV